MGQRGGDRGQIRPNRVRSLAFLPTSEPPTSDAKPLVDVLDSEPFLPPDVVELAAWVADYYACGVGEAIATAMPPRAWIESERHAAITDAGEARMLSERGARRDVLELLTGGRVVSVGALARRASAASHANGARRRSGAREACRGVRGAKPDRRRARRCWRASKRTA